jgi:hypothetical protein
VGSLLARNLRAVGELADIREAEFGIFSQWGDDGIIQYLIRRLDIRTDRFVEFGVSDYTEANTRFLLHEPRGGVGGQATDVEIQAREIIKMRQRLNQIFADATGKSLEQIKKDTDRDFWMSAEEAMAYGLVGKIVRHRSEIT